MKAPRIARSEEVGGEMQENNDNAYTTSLKIDTDTNRIIATAEEQADSRSSSVAQGGGGVTGAAAVAVGPGARPARWSAAATAAVAAYTKIEFFLQLGQMESKEKENKTKTENGRE